MIDFDNFKNINDTFVAFRYGGEEFLCIVKKDESQTRELMNEIKETFNKTCLEVLNNLNITFSAGVSRASHDKSVADIIKEADSALYVAKAQGKNRVVIYEN